MTATSFNHLEAARALENAGFTRDQAEAAARAMRQAAVADRQDLATKTDIAAIKWILAVQSAFILAVVAKVFSLV